MPIQIGTTGQPGFDEPIALMMDCHRRIESFLGVIERVVHRDADGPLHDDARNALRTALRYFRHSAPHHTADEEESLFPRLRAMDRPGNERLLERADALEQQHRVAEALHDRVHTTLDRWLAGLCPAGTELKSLLDDLATLRSLYSEHIAFEDEELFPAAASQLDDAALAAIGHEMAARRGRPVPGGTLATT
ncbi:MAG: hemerythrin domain-containing protein [Phycisphaerales bacterium]